MPYVIIPSASGTHIPPSQSSDRNFFSSENLHQKEETQKREEKEIKRHNSSHFTLYLYLIPWSCSCSARRDIYSDHHTQYTETQTHTHTTRKSDRESSFLLTFQSDLTWPDLTWHRETERQKDGDFLWYKTITRKKKKKKKSFIRESDPVWSPVTRSSTITDFGTKEIYTKEKKNNNNNEKILRAYFD